MNRRNFLRATAASTLVAATGVSRAAAARRRPNVLYVFDDQHRAASLPGEPHCEVIAPTLDAFRRANFSMDTCVSNYPFCTPYRGIFLTGRWPYQTGIVHNNMPVPRDALSLGRLFKDQGYRTAYVGKWHLQKGDEFIPAGPDRQGFEDWHVWVRTDDHYTSWTYDPNTGERIDPKGWSPVGMTDQAIDILKKPKPDAPWFMVVSYNPPHPPYDPPAEEAQRYKPETFDLRPNIALPLNGQKVTGYAEGLTGDAALRRATQGYYGAITGVDEQFARLLKTLEETGQAEDTIVVFTSDHGDMLGSQGRMGKGVPFEESVRVPFLVRYPGVTKPRAKSHVLFAAVDIYPTMCGLAGIPVPRHCVGRDLSSVMRGEPLADKPTHTFLMSQEFGNPGNPNYAESQRESFANVTRRYVNMPNYRGIRTETHTYAVADTGRWILYDNVADPYQMKNLVGDPSQKSLMDGFDRLIAAWLKEADDPFPYAENLLRVSTFPTGTSGLPSVPRTNATQ